MNTNFLSLPRAFRPAWRACALWMFACCHPAAPQAATFKIQSYQLSPGGFSVQFESAADSYYILRQGSLNGSNAAVAMQLGVGGGTMSDARKVSHATFYWLQRVPIRQPLDIDQDGMDDVYEIQHRPSHNPLNSGDAQADANGNGLSNLADYKATKNAVDNYLVGRGMHDVTGPAAEGSMMGYANGDQITQGIHDRQWARAFVVANLTGTSNRVALVVVDAGQLFHGVTQGVYDKIRADAELRKYYSYTNIVLSATHTHGGAGGHAHHVLFNLSIGGHSWQAYDALVYGIYMAIKKAHLDLKPGTIFLKRDTLLGAKEIANENRRPIAFRDNVEVKNLANPFVQRGSTDRDAEMSLLRFEANGSEIGMLNWFAVHGTSVSQDNKLLTSDNKGYAAYHFELEKGNNHSTTNQFVAGFANSNCGDMSPNLWSSPTAWPAGVTGQWPANNTKDYYRAEVIGQRQLTKAKALYDEADQELKLIGPVDSRHLYVDFTGVQVKPNLVYPYVAQAGGFDKLFPLEPRRGTYLGALGAEFGKGTRDGPTSFSTVIDAFKVIQLRFGYNDPITSALEILHAPKRIILTTGAPISFSLAPVQSQTWSPQIIPISILQVGQLAILAVPAEFTVMAGWRLRQTVKSILGSQTEVVIAGLANSYSGYVTTYEEYTHLDLAPLPEQGYEAASTHFGPLTLAAYQQEFAEMAKSLKGQPASLATLPMPRTFVPSFPTSEGKDPVFDPSQQFTSAVFKEAEGCPTSAPIADLLSGYCWACPSGYVNNLLQLDKARTNACVKPESVAYTNATRRGAPGCAAGQFFDVLSGVCWSCPSGYENNLLQPDKTKGDACVKPASSAFATASSAAGSGFFGTDCPQGYVYDLVLGRCYRCPSGYNKVVLRAWNNASACEKVTPASYTAATRHDGLCPSGSFLDLATGACWSCPSGYERGVTVFPIGGPQACRKITPAKYAGATKNRAIACEQRNSSWFSNLLFGPGCWSCDSGWSRTKDSSGNIDLLASRSLACAKAVSIGTVQTAPLGSYKRGNDVAVAFWAGHPKNVFGTKSSRALSGSAIVNAPFRPFFSVQKLNSNVWRNVGSDADWDTEFRWNRPGEKAASIASIKWTISTNAPPGTYRIQHSGVYLDGSGKQIPYSGTTPQFEVQ